MQDYVCLVVSFPFWQEPLDALNVMLDFNITGGGEVWNARP
jgi:hypothetical protein